MNLALSCAIDPDLAAVLRAKMRLPHQRNPPMEWGAIQYLAAFRFGALTGFSDGRTVAWSSGGPATRRDLAAHSADVARLIAERGRAGQRPQGTPRAFPLGGLRDGRMLWKLCSYRSDHLYVADLLLLDAARQRVDLLRRGSERVLSGTEPKCVFETDAPDVCYVTGDIDAGAAAHLDDFIMVDTCWRVDLAGGTYAPHAGAPLQARPPQDPLLACTAGGYVSGGGLTYFGEERFERRAGRVRLTLGERVVELDDVAPDLPGDGRWFVHAIRDGRRLLLLDLRAGDRADVYADG